MSLTSPKPRRGYIGWLLPEGERDNLLARVPPIYDVVLAHHCTLAYDCPSSTPLPTTEWAEVVGVADDCNGVQALVLSIDGSTARPDGSTFHITWSLARGRRPAESNNVIRERGWTPVAHALRARLIPTFFPFGGI